MDFVPHFSALLEVFDTAVGGPSSGAFVFPESGVRSVPLDVPELDGVHTAHLHYAPGAGIPNGTAGEVIGRVVWEAGFAPHLVPGSQFHVWDGHHVARGTVLEVFAANWTGTG